MNEEELLTCREVAALLRVDENTVRRWLKAGILEAVLLPKTGHCLRQTYRVKRSVVEELLAAPASRER